MRSVNEEPVGSFFVQGVVVTGVTDKSSGGTHKDGKREGLWTWWDEDGNVTGT
ncbi:MAG: hypothetical protein VX679_02005 [Pseudomonadota bacterium]|nr:hypothetical protein [Pseudomonadota bacterium]